jgi:hypothetical protein
MIYVFHINTDDKETGWFPPSDNSGKIYVNARGWTSNPQDSKRTYDQAEHFLWLLDKYGSHAVGNHYFLQWIKSNRSKTFLDKVTASDIAYTMLVYENTKKVWEEDLQIKASSRTDEEMHNAMHHKKNQVSCRKVKASQKVWRWLGRQWTRVLPRISQDLQAWLGILIFGSNFQDPHQKWNSDSIFDSGDSGQIFFEIPMSGKSENWNSDL